MPLENENIGPQLDDNEHVIIKSYIKYAWKKKIFFFFGRIDYALTNEQNLDNFCSNEFRYWKLKMLFNHILVCNILCSSNIGYAFLTLQ